jgi:formiminoglutamase
MSKFFQWNYFDRAALDGYVARRSGEKKLGEAMKLAAGSEFVSDAKFHVLGVAEDIGPRLNNGRIGARNAFHSFVSRFVNVQSNQFLLGDEICLHGWIEPKEDFQELSHEMIDDLDVFVSDWVTQVVLQGGVPIVIGGGHNNAYPLIKGVSAAFQEPIDVCNLDPHADTRSMEGRHSGNPFSYAFHQGYLKHYAVLGLHESYNNQFILDQLIEMKAYTSFFESWLEKNFKFQADIDSVFDKHFHRPTGVELDMDAIAYMPSSAFTPSGISVEQARIYVRKMAGLERVCYLHLPEAAPQTEAEQAIVGKALTYLAIDFMKEYLKHHH